MNHALPSPSPSEITQKGGQIYLQELKGQLEKSHVGEYVVIEVESKQHFVNKDLALALNQARKKFPDRLFFIVQIGTLSQPAISLKKTDAHEWLF